MLTCIMLSIFFSLFSKLSHSDSIGLLVNLQRIHQTALQTPEVHHQTVRLFQTIHQCCRVLAQHERNGSEFVRITSLAYLLFIYFLGKTRQKNRKVLFGLLAYRHILI